MSAAPRRDGYPTGWRWKDGELAIGVVDRGRDQDFYYFALARADDVVECVLVPEWEVKPGYRPLYEAGDAEGHLSFGRFLAVKPGRLGIVSSIFKTAIKEAIGRLPINSSLVSPNAQV
jgi:hypothetical protein